MNAGSLKCRVKPSPTGDGSDSANKIQLEQLIFHLLLAEKIKLSIEDSSLPLWFPNLTPHLAETGRQVTKNEFGLTSSNYGTARILSGDINAPRSVFPFKDKSGDTPFSIELLPKELTDNYSDTQIDFYNAAELTEQPILECLTDAIELIKAVPSLSESVFTLAKSLHLIKLDDDAFDVSFSEPQLPFSIFISIPKNRIKADSLRVAEAIVHEAMHLQLSLIERIVPLINSNEQEFYSPWKDEYRNSTGILHALYVFRVIDCFLEKFLSDFVSDDNSHHIQNRRTQIRKQIKEMKSFQNSSDLTKIGRLFVFRRLT